MSSVVVKAFIWLLGRLWRRASFSATTLLRSQPFLQVVWQSDDSVSGPWFFKCKCHRLMSSFFQVKDHHQLLIHDQFCIRRTIRITSLASKVKTFPWLLTQFYRKYWNTLHCNNNDTGIKRDVRTHLFTWEQQTFRHLDPCPIFWSKYRDNTLLGSQALLQVLW